MSDQTSAGRSKASPPRRPAGLRAALAASCMLSLAATQQDGCGTSTILPPGIPIAPAAAVLGSGSVRLTWRGAERADSYDILVVAETGEEQQASSKTNSVTVAGLAAGTHFRAQVAAVNQGGSSAAVDVRFATASTAPGALSATATLLGVHLAWPAARGVKGYRLSRWLAGSNAPPVEIGTTSATAFDDVGCERGLRLRYRVDSIPQAPDAKGPEASELCATPREYCVADVTGGTVRTLAAAPGPALRALPPATGLASPQGIAVDASNDEWVVADLVSSASLGTFTRLVFFPGGAGAGTPPLRTLGGPAYPFNGGLLWALDPARNRVIIDLYAQRWAVDRFGVLPPQQLASPAVGAGASASDPLTGLLATFDSGPNKAILLQDLSLLGPTTIGLRQRIPLADVIASPPLAIDGPAGEVVVGIASADGSTQQLTSFPLDGSSAPPLHALQAVPYGAIAIDPVRHELWNSWGGARTAWARSAAGSDPPLRVLAGPHTGLGELGVAVDSVRGELLSSSDGAVVVHAVTASGDAPPLRRFGVGAGALFGEVVALDAARDELYVAGPDNVAVWQRTAGPAEQPLRGFRRPVFYTPLAMAFDPARDELVMLEVPAGFLGVSRRPRTASDADGSGGAKTWAALPGGFNAVALALIGGELWAAGSGTVRLAVIGADGALVRRLDGPGTGLLAPSKVTAGNPGELLVLEPGGRVTALPSAAVDDAPPIFTAATDPGARDLVYDPRAGELLVTTGTRVLVYTRTGNALVQRGALDLGSTSAIAAGIAVCR